MTLKQPDLKRFKTSSPRSPISVKSEVGHENFASFRKNRFRWNKNWNNQNFLKKTIFRFFLLEPEISRADIDVDIDTDADTDADADADADADDIRSSSSSDISRL